MAICQSQEVLVTGDQVVGSAARNVPSTGTAAASRTAAGGSGSGSTRSAWMARISIDPGFRMSILAAGTRRLCATREQFRFPLDVLNFCSASLRWTPSMAVEL